MKKVISAILTLTLVLGSFSLVFASEPWNHGNKVNYTPGNVEYNYAMDKWFSNGVAKEIGIVAYEDLKANANRAQSFFLFERMIQASYDRRNLVALKATGNLLPFEDSYMLSDSAKEEAIILYDRRILNGDNGFLNFEKPVKRSEMATIIKNYDLCFFQLPKFRESKTFFDSLNHWSKSAIDHAYRIGMVNGMGANYKGQFLFGVEYNLSKQELIQIAYNLISGKNFGTYGISYEDLCCALEETFKCTTDLNNNSSSYVTSIDSDIDRVYLDAGKEKTVTVRLKPFDSNINDVKFEMLDEKIALISKIITSKKNNNIINVEVKGLKKGSTELLATSKGNKNIKEYVEINVEDKNSNSDVTEIVISEKKIDLEIGQSKTLDVKVYPTNSLDNLKFTSSNLNVVTVSNSGKVTAVAEGSAYVYAKADNGIVATVKINVGKGSGFDPDPDPSEKIMVMNVRGFGDSFTGSNYYNATAGEIFTVVVENSKVILNDRDISLTGNLSLKSGPVNEENNKYSFVVQASAAGAGNISVLGTNMEIRIY
ncbi:MAG: Ig-like domain-containing protein [Clostridia bacterium]